MSEAAQNRNYDEEKCIVCGHVVRFFENEYKKPCGYCGTWVFEKRKQVSQQEQDKNKEPKCWICMDKGIVEYPVQQGMGVYTYVARCTCPEGLKLPSAIPLLSECQLAPKPEFIELRNREICGLVWESKEGGMGNGE